MKDISNEAQARQLLLFLLLLLPTVVVVVAVATAAVVAAVKEAHLKYTGKISTVHYTCEKQTQKYGVNFLFFT